MIIPIFETETKHVILDLPAFACIITKLPNALIDAGLYPGHHFYVHV